MRVKATIEYLGTNFAGWQVQPNDPTVQAALEGALGTVLGRPCQVSGAGRTDAGVHAVGQVAAFDLAGDTDLYRLRASLNALTPEDIAVITLDEADEDFDPRRDAVSRTYRYCIVNGRPPSPFLRDRSWYISGRLSENSLNNLARQVMGEHDFSGFRASDCEAKTTVRTVTKSVWSREEGILHYEIVGNAFLKNMVRVLVGTMVEIEQGKMREHEFATLLAGGERVNAGRTAPARGLTLMEIEYP